MELSDLADTFPGHYWPTDEELRRLWNEGVLVLDASVLLGFYRYSDDTQEAMFRVLARFGDRVFVPHQAAEEFQRNRITVISQQVAAYEDFGAELNKSVEALRSRARELRRHPVLDADEVLQRLDAFEQDLASYIKTRSEEHPNRELTPSSLMRDGLRDRIQSAIGKRVGPSYDETRCAELEAHAKERFEREQPPGYRDKDKDEPRRFGDVYFWMQALDFARESGLPTIIVTDDEKDDWWWRFKGKTLGPRYELIAEMRTASKQPMFMYTSRDLLSKARDFLSETVSESAIDEVQEIARELRTRTASESVGCPHCGWAPITISIGVARGSSAIGTCPSCNSRFHAHRSATGEVQTNRGSLGRRIQVRCPECGEQIGADIAPGEEVARDRICMGCFAMLDIAASGGVRLNGFATVVDSDSMDDRHIACPRCGTYHVTSFRREGMLYAVCYAGQPRLLLRSRAAVDVALDPD
ncbi:PIN-like domain-containing protein [Candidatus Poriferisodalis sp.]|uniref:PIN-like domain-containing protein n=1 Tax=Candidatus Poriferisodalis sp. TaxID=3101277 RepID=UPI003B02D8CA